LLPAQRIASCGHSPSGQSQSATIARLRPATSCRQPAPPTPRRPVLFPNSLLRKSVPSAGLVEGIPR